MSGEFVGKYRGVVTDNRDPLTLGRLRARVPDVTGDAECGWAMPCAPFGGSRAGLFAVPARDAGVWIEFEHGDPDYPIWVGCWWGVASEMPTELLAPPPPWEKVMVRTAGGHSILLDDTPVSGGIRLETAQGAKVALTGTGIEIANGSGASVKLTGPKLSVNDGALDVV